MTEDNLLKKWLNNELTDTEKEVFSKQDDYILNRNIIDKAQYFKASKFSQADNFTTFRENYNSRTSVKRIDWVRPFLKIASVLIVGLAVYFSFFNSNQVEIKTLLAENIAISLPDLSKVTLNADSEITYDADSWDVKRSLNLKGEAYFKVAKGKTFNVITNSGTITVIGTEFNIKARKDYFEVNCFEGIVKVESDSIIKQLLAGDTFRILNKKFSQGKTIETKPKWISNKSNFKAVPLKEVFAELERQYNVRVTFKNMDTSRNFTGVFVNDNIENALISITKPMNLTFKISSHNQVLINGNKN